jgi:hypothetical protein
MPEEEVRKASGAMKHADRVKRWYPTDHAMTWPSSVLTCQRSNAVWARRQHRTYGRLVALVATAWFVIGIVIAVADSTTLGTYLITVALPSLPAFLDATEMSRQHRQAGDRRQTLEDQTDALLRDGTATDQDLRELQDQLFSLRRDEPLVPEWFYKLAKSDYEADMRYAAQLASGGPPPTQGEE